MIVRDTELTSIASWYYLLFWAFCRNCLKQYAQKLSWCSGEFIAHLSFVNLTRRSYCVKGHSHILRSKNWQDHQSVNSDEPNCCFHAKMQEEKRFSLCKRLTNFNNSRRTSIARVSCRHSLDRPWVLLFLSWFNRRKKNNNNKGVR